MTHPFNSRTRFTTWGLWILAVIMADQAIKATVEASMPLGTSIAITAGFNWVHAINPGAAFSFLADAGGWQRIFRGRGLTVSAILVGWLWRGVSTRVETAACILITGGGMGNVIDRLRIGAVVDYLDFYWRNWHWPAFNLADIAIVFGAMLFVWSSFTVKTGADVPRKASGSCRSRCSTN
ncbi:signal peptidase II [Candidatus Skiveiella danica]|uniref:signal peptidase II n=1 Tax=Candidatus Skiveiella danica TaxID=3386177 RepID=UPI001DF9547C|nr:signal peptidase II [Betaproteobacteria bacterium]